MDDRSIIKKLYHLVYYGAVIPIYESVRKVDFYENIPPSVEEHNQYMMTTLRMRSRLRLWLNQQHISSNDNIIDVGCGKGKMLHFFQKYSFGLVDGIEYDESIADIAKANMRILHGGVKRVHIMVEDATKFENYDNYNYIYFFNSFKGELLIQFLQKVKMSVVNHPRKILLIYSHVSFGRKIMLQEGFTIVNDYPNENIAIYTYEN